MARNLNTLDVFGKLTIYSLPGCFCAQILNRKKSLFEEMTAWFCIHCVHCTDTITNIVFWNIQKYFWFYLSLVKVLSFLDLKLQFKILWRFVFRRKRVNNVVWRSVRCDVMHESLWVSFLILWCFVNQRKSLSNAHMCIIFRIWWNKKVCNINI